jgi:hypothetical protein
MKARLKTFADLALATLLCHGAAAQEATATTEELQERIAALENLAVRSQSHVMMDVEYHFGTLWFAAQSQQWDLAAFMLKESRSHLAWTVRMRPVRTVPTTGGTVELKPFEDAIASSFDALDASIKAQNLGDFEAAYKETLTRCHACHTASGLGFIEPQIPTHSPSTMLIREK